MAKERAKPKERKRMEEELRKYHNHLEELVRARTAELESEITKRKQAEEALQRSLQETARGQRLLLALSQVAQAVQRARTPDEVYQAIGDEITRLGYQAVIFTLTDDRKHLAISHLTFEAGPVRAAEKRAGISVEDFRLPLAPGNFLQRITAEGETAFRPTGEIMAEALPEPVRPLASQVAAMLDMKQSILAPLTVGGETYGLLVVSGTGLTEADVPAVTAFANQAAMAIENARLYEETRAKAEELTALYDVSLDVAAELEIPPLLKTIVQRAIELLGGHAGGLYLYDPEKQELELIVAQGLSKDYRGTALALGEGACGKAAQTGEPLVVTDYANWEGRAPQFADELTYNVLAVPITRGDTLLGTLFVDDPDVERRFEEGDIHLATLFANQAAIAVENAQLYEEKMQRLTQMAALRHTTLDITSQLDMSPLLHSIIERAAKLLGATGGVIHLHHPIEKGLEIVASQGLAVDYTGEKLKLGEGVAGKVIQSGEPLIVNDYKEWEGKGPQLVDGATRAIIGVPMRWQNRVIGVLDIIDQGGDKIFDEDDIWLLSLFADQAAIAIENARLYEQTDEKLRHRVAELTALNAIAESLTRTLELDEIMESIVRRVAKVMQARICTIRLVEGDELTIGAAVGYKDASARQHTIKIDERLARIVRDQRPLMVEDLWKAKDTPPSRQMRAWREEVHSFLGVPMISKGQTIGILSIYGEEPHRFTQEEISLLLTIANQAALAIENARLYERARGHAEELEQLVEERTKELRAIHAELLQSAKLATLGQLAAGVAHELNNPLGAVSGYLELLQEEMELRPQEMEYMGRIEKRIQQATKIVGELKSLGMPSEPAWQTIDVNNVLEETLTLVERRLSLHQIKVQREMAPHLPQIHADPDRLQQVFINLITNARQAMEEGGTLRVVSRESRNGEWLEMIFADTGEGIAKEHLDKLFTPFFTTRSPGEGMGLGLSVSLRHVRDHGGAIDAWSERGRGTVFRVVLPPLGAQRCWEILDCHEKERCKAVRVNADYRCWAVIEDVSRCERCEVYRRKALPPIDGSLLPR